MYGQEEIAHDGRFSPHEQHKINKTNQKIIRYSREAPSRQPAWRPPRRRTARSPARPPRAPLPAALAAPAAGPLPARESCVSHLCLYPQAGPVENILRVIRTIMSHDHPGATQKQIQWMHAWAEAAAAAARARSNASRWRARCRRRCCSSQSSPMLQLAPSNSSRHAHGAPSPAACTRQP